jgi:uncharacterized repeat protein (TIGR01451 family)
MASDIRNGDFETGTLDPWEADGTAFADQPRNNDPPSPTVHVPPARIGVGGDYWRGGTDFQVPVATGRQGTWWISTNDDATGTLVSNPFVVSADRTWFSCLVGGSDDPAAGVQVLIRATEENRSRFEDVALPDGRVGSYPTAWAAGEQHYVLFHATGTGGEELRRAGFDLDGFAGDQARVRIIDGSTSSHVNADDFRMTADQPDIVPIAVPSPSPPPVWGFADVHAHPLANLAFGGRLYWGAPEVPIDRSLARCPSDHISVRLLDFIQVKGHAHDGYPGFTGWPRFNDWFHQHMYVEWIERAYQGGLRLMVALVVNDELLAWANGGENTDDRASVEVQVRAIKDLVGRHPEFMAIAGTPAEARSIIAGDRLAVVLGVEVDSLGNWKAKDEANDVQVFDYISHLSADLGVRHIFPVHLANGILGGAAVFNDMFNYLNVYLHGEAYQVKEADADVEFRLRGVPELSGALDEAGWKRLGLAVPDYSGVPGGHANVLALTPQGRTVLRTMMDFGMLIDIDHMSQSAAEEALTIAEQRRYPLIAGHAGFRERAWSRRRDETDAKGKVANEYQRTWQQLARLRLLSGLVAVGVHQGDVRSYSEGVVRNDAAGSSKSWAQAYLYAVDQMGGVDAATVALGTDMVMLGSAAPRFGMNACYDLDNPDHADPKRRTRKRADVFAQTNGVRYDHPVRSYGMWRFDGVLEGDVYDHEERLAWEGIALFSSGQDPDTATMGRSSDEGHADDQAVLDIAKGFRAASPEGLSGEVQRAAYLAKSGQDPSREDPEVQRWTPKIVAVWQRWQAMEGDNPPLARLYAGERDFDINLDGVATYGLLPDFLQDLRNVGLTERDLGPLLRSAEGYIRVWEQCDRRRPATLEASVAVDGVSTPVVVAGHPVASPAATVDLGTLRVGKATFVTLSCDNFGPGEVAIERVALAGDLRAFAGARPVNTRVDASSDRIRAKETEQVVLAFTPTEPGPHAGAITVQTSARNAPSFTIAVHAMVNGVRLQTVPSDTVNFGIAEVGNTVARVVTVRNTGNANATIEAVTLSDEHPSGQFAVPSGVTGLAVAAGHEVSFELTYAPHTTGEAAAAAHVTAADAAAPGVQHDTRLLALVGAAVAPQLSLSATELTFADQRVRTTSGPQAVTVTNTGSAPLVIRGIAARPSAEFTPTSSCQAGLAVGAQCAIAVTFSPAGGGGRGGTLTIDSNAPGSPHTVALGGVGLAEPIVALDRTAVSFGSQPVGTSGPARAVTVTNDGVADLHVSGVAVTGPDAADFQLDTDCTGRAIRPEGTCATRVRFRPNSTGPRTAQLAMTDDADGSPHLVSLDGVGVAAPPVTVDPSALDFGTVALGAASAGRTITLTINAAAPVTLSSVRPTGVDRGDFRIAPTSCLGAALAPGATCTIDVAFQPRGVGARNAQLIVEHDAMGSPQEVPLAGVGAGSAVSFDPHSLAFPPQPVGSFSQAQEVMLRNVGNIPLSIVNISVRGDFQIASTCGSHVPAGGFCAIRVICRPMTAGPVTGTVVVLDDAPGSPHSLPLTGTGGAPGG